MVHNFLRLEIHTVPHFYLKRVYIPILQQLWFLHPVKCNLCANWVKSVLTFSAERLITEFSDELHICRDEVQSCGQWLFFPQCKFFRLSCQRVSVCSTKAALTWWLFFLQGHKNEMDTVLAFMLFHLLMRCSFSGTVKACMLFRALSRSKSPSCRIKTNMIPPK